MQQFRTICEYASTMAADAHNHVGDSPVRGQVAGVTGGGSGTFLTICLIFGHRLTLMEFTDIGLEAVKALACGTIHRGFRR